MTQLSSTAFLILSFGISGKIKWIREESLADIAVVEMVDLPLADSEGSIEKQLKSDNGMFDMIFDSVFRQFSIGHFLY